MPKITSIDALIERVKEAYPGRPGLLDRVVGNMKDGYPAAAYDILVGGGLSRRYSHSVSHKEILECVDVNGDVITEKFAELIEKVHSEIRNAKLEPIRLKLENDFKDSYDFTWVSDV